MYASSSCASEACPFSKAKAALNRRRILNLRKYLVVAALVFWLPDIILHAITRDRFGGWLELICLTIFLPIFSCLAVGYAWKASGDIGRFLPAGWSAVLGIWVSGPVMIAISLSFSGGTFR